jgi:peptidoglycan-associated lipoprotein
MTNHWLRGAAMVALAGLVLAGCASKGSKAEPANGGVAPYDGQTAPASGSGAQSYGFDADGNPFVPGTNQPLTRVFYFDYDQSQLSQSDLTALEMHGEILRNNPERAIVVEGHADERGSREYNLALGQKRSDAVRKALTLLGAKEDQLEAVSLGEEKPVCTESTEECWAKNRRGDMLYSGEF